MSTDTFTCDQLVISQYGNLTLVNSILGLDTVSTEAHVFTNFVIKVKHLDIRTVFLSVLATVFDDAVLQALIVVGDIYEDKRILMLGSAVDGMPALLTILGFVKTSVVVEDKNIYCLAI